MQCGDAPVSAARAETCAAEIVSNKFETSYGGWYECGDTVILHAENGRGVNGSKGMTVTGRQSPEDGAAADKHFYLTGGVRYRYSVQVRSEADERFHESEQRGFGSRKQR